ncbi:MAG: SH3 domain-containing protein, partial [Anaerolineae bacterium]|nr:SH3 domain-containing protein [Anaerolineae bacterium]
AAFTPPTQPFVTGADTALLYHFDEGTGNQITDTSANGTNGVRQPGGSPAGPEWSTETPFTNLPATPTNTQSVPPTNTLIPSPTNTALPSPTFTPPPTDTSIPPPTGTSIPSPSPTFAPTDTPIPPPTDTPIPPPTNTLVPPPTDTPISPPTDTPIPPPTNTPIPPPTDTPIPPPTNTPISPPTNTLVPPPTNTLIPPPTNTLIPPPTNTLVPPPTNTLIPAPVYSSNPIAGGVITINGQPGQTAFGTLQITNSGGGTLTVSAITVTGSPQIALISSSSFSLGAGITQVASIQCASPISGVFTSVMQVFHNASGFIATYSVVCNIGVTQPAATATPIGFVASPTPLPPGAPTPIPPAVPPTGNVVEVDGLAIRTGPYLFATLIGVARPGTTYTVLARNQDEGEYTWYLIRFGNNQQGWVSGRYFSISGTESLALMAGSIFDQIDDAPDVGVRATTRAIIDLRPRPTGRMEPIATIPLGVELIVVGRTVQNGGTFWLHVRYGDQIGWIPAAPVSLRGDVSLLPVR